MKATRKIILISCDSPRSVLDFRGKLIETLLLQHEVNLYTPQITQPSVREKLLDMGVHIYENSLQPSTVNIVSDIRYIIQLFRLIRKLKPAVFFPYTFKPVIYGLPVARFCGVPMIRPMLTGLGYNFTNQRNQFSFLQFVTRMLLKFSLTAHLHLEIIFQNKDDQTTLLTLGIIGPKNKVHIVNGSGVDLQHYSYSSPAIDTVSFLMMARLITAKGVKEYYEAAKLLKVKFPQIRFKLIGAYEKNVDVIPAALYQNLIADGVVEYLGLVADVRSHIKASSVVVLPSYYGEGVPRCLLEAMAMGRAIITCNSVGCKETVKMNRKNTNGFLIPIKDVVQLASKMEHYINHHSDIISYGMNGRKYAGEKFDVQKINRAMIRILTRSTMTSSELI